MISINGMVIKPTKFPDKTSQIWYLDERLLNDIYSMNYCKIVWNFESEDEFLHLAQLKTLIDTYTNWVDLSLPFLPYGRQDKRIDNNCTFALTSFATLLNSLDFSSVETIDVHNPSRLTLIKRAINRNPVVFIQNAMDRCKPDFLMFPDGGACKRYSPYNLGKFIEASKIREPSTGNITSFAFKTLPKGWKGSTILVVDDLCDGGMTFKILAHEALTDGFETVHLYTTHGIYSKGIQTLRDSGITRIFNKDGEVQIDGTVKPYLLNKKETRNE